MMLTTAAALVARARAAMGAKTIYKLGAGGMSPTAGLPGNLRNECDCSGFTSWVLGMSRQTTHPLYVRFNGGWVNTDAMVHDAKHGTGFFTQISVARVGALVVYSGGGGKVGHVGIITKASDRVSKVIHCSSGNYRKTGDAIQETDPAVFLRPDTVFAWFDGVDL